MKKIFSVLLTLALVLGFSLVATTPVSAQTTYYVDDSGSDGNGGTGWGDAWLTIQHAVDTVASGDTIMVGAGTYAGAIVDRQVAIVGAAGGGSIITSGVCYKSSCSPAYTTAFRLDAGADSTEIRNFTINNNAGTSFYFAVFSRAVDDVIIDSLEINDTVQGITNWGGSGWTITNNTVSDTVAAGGGGIGILLGALPPSYRTCSDNLVQYNTINATATAAAYTAPGICLSLDTRYGAYSNLDFTEDLTGNQILDNTVVASGANNGVGIEVGTIIGNTETDPDRTDPTKIAACMGLIHDNYVEGNTIDNVDLGLYFYVVEDLIVRCNEVQNCVTEGIHIEPDFTGSIHFNSIHDNAYGLNSTVSNRTIDATNNWWGATDGPGDYGPGSGDDVSDYVDYDPFITQDYTAQDSVTPTTGGTAYFSTDDGNIVGLNATPTPPSPPVELPYGMFEFTICCIDPGATVTLNITLPGPVPAGSVWWKYQNGSWSSLPIGDNDGDNFITVALIDNGQGDEDSILGQITDDGGPGSATVGWETYPTNKVRVLLPWIALFAAIMVGASLLLLRRRRAQS